MFTETRLLVDASTGWHCIPDVMALAVRSNRPDDTFDDILNLCFDYAKLAVQNTLVMDPDNKRAWMFRDHNLILLVGDELRFEWINKARHLHEVALPFTLMFGNWMNNEDIEAPYATLSA